ncbi:hypothetical protein [Natrinema versiforme]|uniref:Uncharacterized protein n=1 Tax=Natrinema versiforme TaxID=88724 RepID=A0A4P8WPG8_9EURY|nr:hypothetical protein [Natrinema versiforme]QCS44383.1 hypothetical protein FEJ81_18605 [Natrinema versiforme]
MGRLNRRNHDPDDLVDELTDVGILSKHQSQAVVYFEIKDDPEKDARSLFDISEKELEDERERANDMIEAAETTINVSKSDMGIEERIEKLHEDGVLLETEAKAYVHSERADESTLVDMVKRPPSDIKSDKETAKERIKQCYDLAYFLDEHAGIEIY